MVVLRKTAMAIDLMGFILFSTKDTQVEPDAHARGSVSRASPKPASQWIFHSPEATKKQARHSTGSADNTKVLSFDRQDSYPLERVLSSKSLTRYFIVSSSAGTNASAQI